MGINTAAVERLYLAYFDRPADPVGEAFWESKLSATVPATQAQLTTLAAGFSGSAEYAALYAGQSNTQIIDNLYLNLFGRHAEPAGLIYWAQALGGGTATIPAQTFAQIALQLTYSAQGTDATAIANKLAASTAFTTALDTTAEIVGYSGTAAAASARTWLATVTDVTATLTAALATVDTAVAAAVAAGTATEATSFTLTTGVDIQTANLFFADLTGSTGNPSTLQSFDVLTGAANSTANKLTIVDGAAGNTGASADVLPVGVTLSNINNITLNTAGNAGGTIAGGFDTTGVTGLTSVNVTSNATGADVIKASATADVTETHNAAAGAVTTVGGKNITVTSNSSGAVIVGGAAATDPAGAVIVNQKGSGTVAVDGGTTVTVTSSGTAATGGITIGAAVAPSGAVTVTDTSGTGTISIQGASATVSSTATAANVVQVTGVTGATTVNVSAVTNGNSYVTGGTGATFTTTGGGNVTLGSTVAGGTLAPIVGNATITDTNSTRTNTDALTIYASGTANVNTTATAGNIIVGVAVASSPSDPTGAVTIVNQTVAGSKTYYGTSTTAVYTNGTAALSITGGAGTTIADEKTTNALATVTLTGVNGAVGITDTALTTLTINNNTALNNFNGAVTATVVTVADTANNDHTLAVNLSGDTNTGTAIVDVDAKVINVTATGTTANYIGITAQDTPAAGNKAINFTNNGTGVLNVGTVDLTNGTAIAVTTAGTGAVNLGNVHAWTNHANVASITGGAGAVTATIGGTETTFTGGSGANVITMADTGSVTKVINGGTGGNNTVIYQGPASDYAAAPGLGISNFQNVQLGTGVTGNFDATPYTTSVANNQHGNVNLGFTNVGAGVGVSILDTTSYGTNYTTAVAPATSKFVVSTFGAATETVSVIVNGVTITKLLTGATNAATAASAIVSAINAVFPGIATNTLLDTTTGVAGAATATVYINAYSVGNVSTDGIMTFTPQGGAAGTTEAQQTPVGVFSTALNATAAAALGNTLPITLNSATGAMAVSNVLVEGNNQTISINSVKDLNNHTNVLSIADNTVIATVANQATAINISGSGKLTLDYNLSDAGSTVASSKVATIDAHTATGNVNVTGVVGKTTGMTITGGTGSLTAFGSGMVGTGLTGGEAAASYLAATDVITTGSGGGTITVGYAGAGGNTGTTTINLGASTAKSDTIKTTVDTTYGGRATINGFAVTGSSTTADKLTFAASKTVLATNAVAAPATAGTDTYTVSNGIITFSGADSVAQQILDAIAIVDAGTNNVAAFVAGGNTYVVASGGTADATHADVLTFNTVTGITQLGGTTAAAGNLLSGTTGTGTIIGASAVADTTAAAVTLDDTGYSIQAFSGATSGTHTFNNLAASATVTSTSTGTFNLATTQVGTAGQESMTLNLNAGQTLTTATFTGDNALTINTSSGGSVITTLVDPGNTLAKLTIAGNQTLTIGAITDTALTSITINDTVAVSLGGSTTPLTQNGLAVTIAASSGSTYAAPAHQIFLSGTGDTIDISGASSTGAGTMLLSATGANSTIKGGIGAEILVGGTGATVTMLQGSTVGTLATPGNSAINIITVDVNSAVTLGTNAAGVASDGGSLINLYTATGSDVTGALSSGAYTMVTLTNVIDSPTVAGVPAAANIAAIRVITGTATLLQFFSTPQTTETATAAAINVASATSLAQALDIAAANEAGGATTHSYDWFQYGGNDYIVGHNGATGTALSATDVVVKVVGLVDLSHLAANTATGIVAL